MQITEKLLENKNEKKSDLFDLNEVSCAWCGGNSFIGSNFTKKFQCHTCEEQFEIQGNLLIWKKNEFCEEGFVQLLKRIIRVYGIFNLLKRALNPVSSPFLPFRYISNLRTRQYYKRTIFERKLAEHWATHYFSELDLPPNAAVLDHGCGKGRNVGLLTQLGFNVSAQDIESHSWWGHFPYCKFQTVPPNAQRLPWPDASFDLILDFGVIGLFPHDKIVDLFIEIRRVLKPQGYWLILEANDNSYGRHAFQQPTLPLHAARLFSREAGFIEVNFSYEGFYSPFFPQLVNFFRKVCGPWRMNLSDFDSWLAQRIAAEKRGLWLLRLRRD